MAWKLENATFVDGDDGLAYSVSLYERLEASNGEVFMARKGPLTEAQASALGFDLSDVLTELNTQSLNALDSAREELATKAARIATLEGDLNLAVEQRDDISGRLADALAQVAALMQELAKAQAEAPVSTVVPPEQSDLASVEA